MPTMTFRKLFLIACIAVLGATLATVTGAETPNIPAASIQRVLAPQTGLPICPMAPAMTPIDAHVTRGVRQTPIPGFHFDAQHQLDAAQISPIPSCANSHAAHQRQVRS